MTRLVGIVPAAGYGTRLALASGSKELVEVGGTPVMDYLLRRLEAAPCDEIRIVTRPEKEDVVAYARRRGITVVTARPPTVSASIAAGLEGLLPDDLVAIGYPDTVWEPLDGFAQLAAALDGRPDVALGLFRTPDAARSDVVVLEGREVVAIDVKPERPRSDLIWGCLVARARALDGLERFEWPSNHLASLGRAVIGVELGSSWVDVGTVEGLARARSSSAPAVGGP